MATGSTSHRLEIVNQVVMCAENELKPYATHPDHEKLIALPGKDVIMRPNKTLLDDHRELRVVESLLIQSRGRRNTPACDYCEEGLGIYADCRSLGGWFGEACGSCKRNDKAASCTLSDAYKAQEQLQKDGIVGGQQNKEETTTKRGRTTKKPTNYYG
ncbi:MAG: Histone transcription regulator 3 [Watsoniomyces obsoletus]|nr:MAG: Histone transcription regulator 3 [Watsoniomyces obsoletus]